MLVVRSLIFNVAFYLNTLLWLILGLPTFLMPYRATVWIAKTWGRCNLLLLRAICGLDVEIRGRDRIPSGPLLVASKHQSAWETFALLHLFDNPAIIFKRELIWIPVFGWLMAKARMVPIDRGRARRALDRMTERARIELADGRQIIVFPEGTRRPAGAEPAYRGGIAYVYAAQGVPCLPVALNSGLFWPRRSWLRRPGKVIVEILDPIPPGLGKKEFLGRLEGVIEEASGRLLEEGRG